MAEYIDKQKLMENFAGYDLTQCQKYGNTSQKKRDMSYDTMMMYEIADEISYLPAADVVQVVHGHWCKELVPFRDKLGNQHFGSCCSKCGGIFDRTKFCGGCGAKMDEDKV